jgi:HSP20 family molecular chaperone IbpA
MSTEIHTGAAPAAAPRGRTTARPTATAAPPVDLYESTEGYCAVIDVPGVTRDGIDVTIENGQLSLRAMRRLAAADLVHALSFLVPEDVDPASIDAHLAAGVLEIRMAKSPAARARRIAVRGGS